MDQNQQNNPGQANQQMPQYPPPYRMRKKSGRWWIPLAIIGGILALIIIIFASIWSAISNAVEPKTVEVKNNSVLYLTFDGGMNEYEKPNPFQIFGGGKGSSASFFTTIKAIERAKNDPDIKGIYMKPSPVAQFGYAKALELRDVMLDFKKSGKFIYAFLEAGNENTYFNLLPADSIFMPTEGLMEFNGFAATSMFFTGMLDKIGVKFIVQHFEDFKSAADGVSQTKFTDSARYQLRVLLDQRYDEFVNAVASSRRLKPEDVKSDLDRGLYTTDSLMAAGLVDGLASELTIKQFIKNKIEGKAFEIKQADKYSSDELGKSDDDSKLNLISVADYYAGGSDKTDNKVVLAKKKIAIIFTVGAISSGTSGGSFNSDYEIKSGDVVKQLREAREDEEVKAIILRIDSPGGSVIASDELWEEIVKTRKLKPVYASMSDVAASGGYYMAMACDTIIAHPATITGSIGVVLALPNFKGTIDKLGITTDTISTNKNAVFLNGFLPVNDAQIAQLHNLSQTIYYRFLSRVAESRHKSFDEIHALAKGRVWTGADAYKHGLVDTLGGLEDAINIAKRRIGVRPEQLVHLEIYPKPVDEFTAFMRLFGKDFSDDASMSALASSGMPVSKSAFAELVAAMPAPMQANALYFLHLLKTAKTEKVMVAMPYLPDFN